MRPAPRLREGLTFGGRLPAAVGGLLVALVLASVAGALQPPLRAASAFWPGLVWEGEIWRLVTYAFFETDPIGLVFAVLMLWWSGRDLALAWGERRFLLGFAAIAASAASGTCLVALVWPQLAATRALGPWPAIDALMVAWALRYPGRQILLWFALPVNGRALLWITVGGTALYALFLGLAPYLPHLLAEGLTALWLLGPRPRLPRIRLPRRRRPFDVIHADRDPDAGRPRWLN